MISALHIGISPGNEEQGGDEFSWNPSSMNSSDIQWQRVQINIERKKDRREMCGLQINMLLQNRFVISVIRVDHMWMDRRIDISSILWIMHMEKWALLTNTEVWRV